MKNNVLFVDDEVHILRAIKRGLIKEKFNKFFASSGDEALEILAKEDIHVIVSDMKMPKMNGLELLTIVNEQYPSVVKVILSGYTQLQQIIVTINRVNIFKFVTKPFDIEIEFKEVLYSAIDLYNTRSENSSLKVSLEKKNALYQKMLVTNNEKLDLIKHDFKFMISFNRVMSNYYYLLATKLKKGMITEVRMQEEINFAGSLFEKVVKNMPASYTEFNMKYLQSKLNKFLKSYEIPGYSPPQVTITRTMEERDYHGDMALIFFVVTHILACYFVVENFVNFYIAVSEKELPDDRIELLLLVKASNNRVIEDKIRTYTLRTFFSNLLEAFEGSLAFQKKEDEHLVLIRIPINLIGKNGDDDE